MPPKAKFTREEIVAAALEITREKGIEAVTAREIGKTLNSSARPIFTVFQLLCMKERTQAEDIEHILPAIDDNFEEIIRSVMVSYDLEQEDALRLYQNIWIYTHGIATLCATKVCRFTQEEISERETEVFTGLIKKIKEVMAES